MTQRYFIILCPGADVIKLFCLYLKKFSLSQSVFYSKLENLSVTKPKLITKIRKLQTKKFLTLGPGANDIKLFAPVIYEQLEYLSLSGHSSLVKCLWIRPEPARAKHNLCSPLFGRLLALPINIRLSWKGPPYERSSLLCTLVNYGYKSLLSFCPRGAMTYSPTTCSRLTFRIIALKPLQNLHFKNILC